MLWHYISAQRHERTALAAGVFRHGLIALHRRSRFTGGAKKKLGSQRSTGRRSGAYCRVAEVTSAPTASGAAVRRAASATVGVERQSESPGIAGRPPNEFDSDNSPTRRSPRHERRGPPSNVAHYPKSRGHFRRKSAKNFGARGVCSLLLLTTHGAARTQSRENGSRRSRAAATSPPSLRVRQPTPCAATAAPQLVGASAQDVDARCLDRSAPRVYPVNHE